MDIIDTVSYTEIISVIFRTVFIFLFAFVVLRLLGKKHLTHFTYVDLLLVIALGSAVGDVMIYDESVTQIFSSIIAISIVGIVVKILNEFTSHSWRARKLLTGEARLIVINGRIIQKALEQEDLDKSELMSAFRLKGFSDLNDIKKAFIEADGEISVISNK